jgi:hypothetical protein
VSPGCADAIERRQAGLDNSVILGYDVSRVGIRTHSVYTTRGMRPTQRLANGRIHSPRVSSLMAVSAVLERIRHVTIGEFTCLGQLNQRRAQSKMHSSQLTSSGGDQPSHLTTASIHQHTFGRYVCARYVLSWADSPGASPCPDTQPQTRIPDKPIASQATASQARLSNPRDPGAAFNRQSYVRPKAIQDRRASKRIKYIKDTYVASRSTSIQTSQLASGQAFPRSSSVVSNSTNSDVDSNDDDGDGDGNDIEFTLRPPPATSKRLSVTEVARHKSVSVVDNYMRELGSAFKALNRSLPAERLRTDEMLRDLKRQLKASDEAKERYKVEVNSLRKQLGAAESQLQSQNLNSQDPKGYDRQLPSGGPATSQRSLSYRGVCGPLGFHDPDSQLVSTRATDPAHPLQVQQDPQSGEDVQMADASPRKNRCTHCEEVQRSAVEDEGSWRREKRRLEARVAELEVQIERHSRVDERGRV